MSAALEPDWWLSQLQQVGSPARLCVAYSGGRDSTVLLHSLARLTKASPDNTPSVRAVHVNHQLQLEAEDWARQCVLQAAQWSVPIQVLTVEVTADGNGLEDAARQARYSAITGQLVPNEWMVTAHHQRDQAETLLLQLFRGSGLKGLAAMPAVRERLGATHWRPLLPLTDADMSRYAEAHGLRWTEDPSNQAPRFRRNWLRQSILPQLREHYPQLDRHLGQTAAHMGQAQRQLNALADQWLTPLLREQGSGLCLKALLAFTGEQQDLILRRWLHEVFLSADQLSRLKNELIHAGSDRQPELRIASLSLRRFGGVLWQMPPLPPVEPVPQTGRQLACGDTRLPAGAGILSIQGDRALLADLSWGFPGGGEQIQPHDQAHHRKLKQLHQTAGVPPWIRERTPLLWRSNQLLSVGGYWNSAAFLELTQKGLLFQWRHDLCAEPRAGLRMEKAETA